MATPHTSTPTTTDRAVPAPVSAIADAATAAAAIQSIGNDPFLLVHYPRSPSAWEVDMVDGAPTWLPAIQPVPLVSGVFGYTGNADSAAAQDVPRNILRGRGAVVLEPEKYGYALKTPCVYKGRPTEYFHTPWQKMRHPLADQPVTPKIDRKALNEFRLNLVKTGAVPEPDEQALAWYQERAESKLAAASANSDDDREDVRGPRLRAAAARVAAIKSAARPWETIEAAPVVPPAKRVQA